MGAGPSKPNIVNGKQVLRVHFDRREVVTEAHEAYEALELDLRRVLTIPDGHQVVMSAYLEFSQGRQVEVDPKLWSALRPQIGEAWITTKPAAEGNHRNESEQSSPPPQSDDPFSLGGDDWSGSSPPPYSGAQRKKKGKSKGNNANGKA